VVIGSAANFAYICLVKKKKAPKKVLLVAPRGLEPFFVKKITSNLRFRSGNSPNFPFESKRKKAKNRSDESPNGSNGRN
jgi:hypothetical protein